MLISEESFEEKLKRLWAKRAEIWDDAKHIVKTLIEDFKTMGQEYWLNVKEPDGEQGTEGQQ